MFFHFLLSQAQSDAVFEVANLMMNFAFWHMKHSAMVAAKSEIDMEEAKKVNKILRQCWEMPKLQGFEVEIPKL